MSEKFLVEVSALAEGSVAEPDLVIGHGPRRSLFAVEYASRQQVVAVDTVYGDGRMFRDELGMAVTFHETLAVITPEMMVIEVRFLASVFGIVEIEGQHVVEMELGTAAVGRGFSPLLWLCETPDIVMERKYAGKNLDMVLFDGAVISIDTSDGSIG